MASQFSDIFDKYQTYDPAKEGYGNPNQWRGAFNERMGIAEARVTIKGPSWEILGIAMNASWAEVRAAYRKRSREVHPDFAKANGMTEAEATEAFKQVSAAYSIMATDRHK